MRFIKLTINTLLFAAMALSLSVLVSCKKEAEPEQAEKTQDEIEAAWPEKITVPEAGEFVLVKRDTFMMGSDEGNFNNAKPAHQVSFSKSFYICTTECTQKQWVDIMGSNPSDTTFEPEGIGDNIPVNNITVTQINEFIEALEAATGRDFDLPSEAQWEWAAMGGVKSQGYTYAGSNNIDDVAAIYNYDDTVPLVVGQLLPNELGIYDMSGNVSEYCRDKYADYSSSAQVDPAPSAGSYYNLRGGSFGNELEFLRVKHRNQGNVADFARGFRLILLAPLDSELTQ